MLIYLKALQLGKERISNILKIEDLKLLKK